MKKLFKITSLIFALMIFVTSCETKPDAMQADAQTVCDLNKKGDTLTDEETTTKTEIEAKYADKAEDFTKAVEAACAEGDSGDDAGSDDAGSDDAGSTDEGSEGGSDEGSEEGSTDK